MYKTAVCCDECGKELYYGDASKREIRDIIKEKGGYASYGIHLCFKHNTRDIKAKFVARKKDYRC